MLHKSRVRQSLVTRFLEAIGTHERNMELKPKLNVGKAFAEHEVQLTAKDLMLQRLEAPSRRRCAGDTQGRSGQLRMCGSLVVTVLLLLTSRACTVSLYQPSMQLTS